MKIEFVESSKLWRRTLPARKLGREAIAAALAESGARLRRGSEMSVHLIDDASMRAINAEWRRKDAPTNVLSFPAADPAGLAEARHLGDVLIAFETVAREAAEEGKTISDHFRHLVVHGFLHLIGYDHAENGGAEAMEALETRALARLGVADPYAERELMDPV